MFNIRARTRGRSRLARYIALGSVVCLGLLATSSVFAATRRTPPSTVKVTGAWSGSFTITKPSDPLQCGIARGSGGRGSYLIVLQKLKRVNTSAGSQPSVVASLAVTGRGGSTAAIPAGTIAGGYFEAGNKQFWAGQFTNPNTGETFRIGSGTVKMSANGRSGSLNAELTGNNPTMIRKTAGKVHIKANWHCTSKFQ
jgi:hypothetical protein